MCGGVSVASPMSLECEEGGFVHKERKAYLGMRETGGDNV